MTGGFDPDAALGSDATPTVVALSDATWAAFAELVERNNGVYGGCWCLGFHPERAERIDVARRRDLKRERVRTGGAHAALVIDGGGRAQAWAQYGDPDELPGIKNRREYEKGSPPRADWRIACVFVDAKHRGQGLARLAVEGALALIAGAGGGTVEAVSEATEGRRAPGRFLFSGTVELLEELGFARVRQVGKHAWLMTRTIAPAPAPAGG